MRYFKDPIQEFFSDFFWSMTMFSSFLMVFHAGFRLTWALSTFVSWLWWGLIHYQKESVYK